jgi:phage repressor protein C with HTH and peptisase S24 domain
MFTHAQVWQGIDRLAKENGLSPSGLARRAGLDPTTFNPSKRVTKQKKTRWPSTESLAKVLTATGTPFQHFVALMTDGEEPPAPPGQRLSCIAIDQADRSGLFDQAGFPTGDDWDEIDFPSVDDRDAYALEVRGDALAPNHRDGDLLVVSPRAGIRRNDRVVAKTRAGEMIVGVLLRRTARRIELAPVGKAAEPRILDVDQVAWLARITWVSQ